MKATPEHFIQCAIADFLKIALPASALSFAVPNGGDRNKIVAAKLKREGVVSGVADLIVIDRRGDGSRVIGLEVKAPKGTVSPLQKIWAKHLEQSGGVYYVVRSIEDVAAALEAEGVRLMARPSTTPGRLYDRTGV